MGSIFGAGNLLSGDASVANFQSPPPSTAILAGAIMASTSVLFIVLLLLCPGITDLGSGVYWYTLVLVYAYVRRLFSYLLHGPIHQGRGFVGALLGHDTQHLVVHEAHDLKVRHLFAPFVEGDHDGFQDVSCCSLYGGVEGLAVGLEVQPSTPERRVGYAGTPLELDDGVLAPPSHVGIQLEEWIPKLPPNLILGHRLSGDGLRPPRKPGETLAVEQPEDESLGELALFFGYFRGLLAQELRGGGLVDVLARDEFLSECLVAGEGAHNPHLDL